MSDPIEAGPKEGPLPRKGLDSLESEFFEIDMNHPFVQFYLTTCLGFGLLVSLASGSVIMAYITCSLIDKATDRLTQTFGIHKALCVFIRRGEWKKPLPGKDTP